MPQIVPIDTYTPQTPNDRGFSVVPTQDGTILLFSDDNDGQATDFQFGVVTANGPVYTDPIAVGGGSLGTVLPTNSQIATTYSSPNSETGPDVRDFLVIHRASEDGIEIQFQLSLAEVDYFSDIYMTTDGRVFLLDTTKQENATATILSETGEILEEGAVFDYDQPNLGIENLITDQGYGPEENVNGEPFFDAVAGVIDIAEEFMPSPTWADILPDGSRAVDYYRTIEGSNPPLVEFGRILFTAPEFDAIQLAQAAEQDTVEIPDEVFVGNSNNNDFYAGSGDDTLIGKGGDDYLEGWFGDDLQSGGKGDDALYGWDGHDTLFGGAGDDYLDGWNGRDKMHGGKGDDYLDGGHGRDSLFGGRGEDNLYGWHGRDLIRGGKGDDIIDGGTGNDRLFGGRGDDEIIGGLGDDKLFGQGGDDNLLVQQGNNTLAGGSGDNSFTDGSGDDLILCTGLLDDVYLGGGNNTVVADADVTHINVAHEGFEYGGFSTGLTEIHNFDLGQDLINLVAVGNTINGNDPDFKTFLAGEISIDGQDAFLSLGDGRSLKLVDVVDDDSVTAEELVEDIFFDL